MLIHYFSLQISIYTGTIIIQILIIIMKAIILLFIIAISCYSQTAPPITPPIAPTPTPTTAASTTPTPSTTTTTLPTCPNGYLPSDIFTAQVTLALADPTSSVMPAITLASDDLYNYTYSLPLPFRKLPSVAIATTDFHSGYSQSFTYYVKYLNTINRQNLTFIIKIDNRLAGWVKLSFNFLAEIRDDILAFSYEIIPNYLVTLDNNKSENFVIPYLEAWNDMGVSKIAVFVNGFDMYSRPVNYPNNSFEIKINNPRLTASGIAINVVSNSTVQIQRIYVSFVVINSKSTAQVISFLNQSVPSGESKYLISPSSIQASAAASTTAPSTTATTAATSTTTTPVTPTSTTTIPTTTTTDLSKYKPFFGLTSFSIDNNSTIPRSYLAQITLATGQIYVNTSTYKFNTLTNSYLLLKTDDCSGCLGYPLYDTSVNSCVSFCPTNSYIQMNQCKYCGVGQHLSNGNTCVTCAATQEWDGSACRCLAGYYRNSLNICDLCPAGTTAVNGKCQCPYLGQYFDDSTKSCLCPPQTYVVNGRCQQCQPGTYWDGKGCVDICAKFANMRWDGQNCICNTGFTLTAPFNCACNGNVDANGLCQPCAMNSVWSGVACVCKVGYKMSTTGACIVDIPVAPSTPSTSTYPNYSPYAYYPNYPSYLTYPSLPSSIASATLTPSTPANIITLQGAILNGINSLALSVKLNGLPSSFMQNNSCPQCSSLFTVQTSLTNTFKTTIQFNGLSAIDGQALFNIGLVFDYFPVQNFNVFVKINANLANNFSVDVSQAAMKLIDLRTLARVDSGNNNTGVSASNIRKDIIN